MYQIYVITNILNGKQYVGKTSRSLLERLAMHCDTHSTCTYIRNAIQKYGKDNFTIKNIITAQDNEEANDIEKKFIKELNTLSPNGYNLKFGGDNGKMHKDTKKKISLANRGKKKPPRSAMHCENLSLAKIGKPCFEKSRGHAKGILHTIEWNNKISASEKGKIVSKESIEKQLISKNRKYFNVYSRSTNEFIGRYNNISECSRVLKIASITIINNLRSQLSRKYKFVYE